MKKVILNTTLILTVTTLIISSSAKVKDAHNLIEALHLFFGVTVSLWFVRLLFAIELGLALWLASRKALKWSLKCALILFLLFSAFHVNALWHFPDGSLVCGCMGNIWYTTLGVEPNGWINALFAWVPCSLLLMSHFCLDQTD